MHSPYFIKLIEKAASKSGISVNSFSGNWAIELCKDGKSQFIVGHTFPLNNSAAYKIARNKNLCHDILSGKRISSVPHEVVLSPDVLAHRRLTHGSYPVIEDFIQRNGFPFLIKKNNSTKGQGVYIIRTQTELERILSIIYSTDLVFCLSPFRKGAREFRNVVLNGRCLLTYEKHPPVVYGDGRSTLMMLLTNYIENLGKHINSFEKAFDKGLIGESLLRIPELNEIVPLQWKHNRFAGTTYQVVENRAMELMAVEAANAISASFVSVDIILTEDHGMEVLEINASVGTHFVFEPEESDLYNRTVDIFSQALMETFS